MSALSKGSLKRTHSAYLYGRPVLSAEFRPLLLRLRARSFVVRRRTGDWGKGSTGLQSQYPGDRGEEDGEFHASLGYLGRSCPHKSTKQKQEAGVSKARATQV